MNAPAWIQLLAYLAVLLLLAWPLARAMEAAMQGRFAFGRRIEAPLYRLAGVDAEREQGWLAYAIGLLVFNGLGVIAVYAMQRGQAVLPLNPQGMAAVAPDSAFNTAISFVTNTNWQGYGGEATMSYLTQMLALTVQNFLSAATERTLSPLGLVLKGGFWHLVASAGGRGPRAEGRRPHRAATA